MTDNSPRRQIPGRSDSEQEQSMIRCMVAGAALLYVFFLIEWQGLLEPLQNAVYCLVGFFLFAFALSIRVRLHPGLNPLRRLLGMLMDQATGGLLMYLLGEQAAPFLFVFLWVGIGSGLRYGRAYLVPAALAGALATGLAGYHGQPWAHHTWLAAGLVIANLLIPAYLGLFLKRLEQTGLGCTHGDATSMEVAGLDALTGLPCQPLFLYQLRKAMARSDRSGELLALVWLSVSGVREAARVHGSETADALLQEISGRLDLRVRGGDTLARVGSQDFALLLEPVHATDAVRRLVAHMAETVALISDIKGRPVNISATVGVVFHAGERVVGRRLDAEALVAMAKAARDQAGAMANDGGRDRIVSCFSRVGEFRHLPDTPAKPGCASA